MIETSFPFVGGGSRDLDMNDLTKINDTCKSELLASTVEHIDIT